MARWAAPAAGAFVTFVLVALFANTEAAGLSRPSASQPGRDSDALAAILTEVRHMRATMDRVATVSPRIQILVTQLQLQHGRVERLANEARGYRSQIDRVTDSLSRNSDSMERLEGAIPAENDPQRRKGLELEREALKAQIDVQTAESQRLRATEAEVAGRLQVEQLQLDELTKKLAELERELATPRR
jgi:chromosome segregation ATPase